jgi:hypothetical protein
MIGHRATFWVYYFCVSRRENGCFERKLLPAFFHVPPCFPQRRYATAGSMQRGPSFLALLTYGFTGKASI